MSPHAANSLVADLVEMAKAHERLPEVQAELSEAQAKIESLLNNVRRLELKLIDKIAEIEAKHVIIRDLEVARDDAEFRFLEADDRTARALDFIKATFGNAGSLIQALEPPKVEPMTESVQEPIVNGPTDNGSVISGTPNVDSQSEVVVSVHTNPTSYTQQSIGTQDHLGNSDGSIQQGQSEPDPTASSQESTTSMETHSGSSQTAEPIPVHAPDDASGAKPGPYANSRYIDYPAWISRLDWLAGGGTDESYDYRG